MKIAVLAVDPGVTTGIAGGVFEIFRNTPTADMMRHAEIDQLSTGSERPYYLMGVQIARLWLNFLEAPETKGCKEKVLVMEDFILRLPASSGARAGLAPIHVIAACQATIFARTGKHPAIVFQTAAQAKGYATDARLKQWGLWKRGLEHGRDAARHLATYLATRQAKL